MSKTDIFCKYPKKIKLSFPPIPVILSEAKNPVESCAAKIK